MWTVAFLPMSMESTFYTIMYNANSVMHHEPRHELYLQFTLLPGPIRTQEIFKCKTDLLHILVHNRQNCPQ